MTKPNPYALPPGSKVRLIEIDCEAFKKFVLLVKYGRTIYVEKQKMHSAMQGCHEPIKPSLMSHWQKHGGERHKFFIPREGVFLFYEIDLVIRWIHHLTENLPMTETGLDRALMVKERLQYVVERG